ncbi:hypothetical protein [Roseibacillus persicicus]|uniref:hypothetical protein n=1 Tax=Roseibacillus persicicus TaxID=454148 RepID=UPI00280EBDC7|nr:hypothetical protein [Roseibacillus persicicus]MDQ8192399.1 hypothetical protein [Roseibacillus persicicus]
MKFILPLASLLTVLLFTSCGSTNTASRIEKNPQIYNSLTTREQELVSQGQIEEGMPPGAVFLALGEPDRRLEGQSEGKSTMRWDYTGLYPVYSNSFYGHFGSGYGRYGRSGRYGSFGIGPTIDYVPVRSSTVWFENDKVRSWERVR